MAQVSSSDNRLTVYSGDSTGGSGTVELTIDDLKIDTQSYAENSLLMLSAALEEIQAARSDIGATQNRLESILESQRTLVESLSSARSQILDNDMATEIAELTRLQILQTAGLSVLTQANANAKLMLNLLRNI